jgi:hypothetical protein
MKLNTLMVIKAVVCIGLGIPLLFVPDFVYSIFGANLNDAGVFAAREYGAALTGTFLLTWFARNAGESRALRAIVLYLFVYDAIGAVVTTIGVLTGVLSPLGWLVAGLYLFFAVGYGYFWFARPVPALRAGPA